MASEQTLEKGIYYLVLLFFSLTFYLLFVSYFGNLELGMFLRVVLTLLASGACLFFIDILAQTFLYQDFLWKLSYLALIVVLSYIGFSFLMPAYSFLLNNSLEVSAKVITVIHLYLLLYWIYRNVKKFFIMIWNIDLA